MLMKNSLGVQAERSRYAAPLMIIFLFACTETKTILVPGEMIVKSDSSAISYQILNTSYADDLLTVSAKGDSIYGFSTARLFTYHGEHAIDVALVRSLAVWRSIAGEDILIGETKGYIAPPGKPANTVAFLLSGESYVYVVVWDGGTFSAANAFYTNFYAKEAPDMASGKSMQKAIAEFKK